MRVFLAVELPHHIKEKLAEIQEKLRSEIPGVRWEKPEKLHITLVFLGEVGEERLRELEEALRSAQGKLGGPFGVRFSEVGIFPKTRPRVVLIEVGEGREEIEKLQQVLARVLSEAGFTFAKLSKPHVTLGRFRRQGLRTLRVGGLSKRLGCKLRTLRVNEITVVRSRLHPAGAIHTPLSTTPLGG